MANSNLAAAKKAKNDEFYTQRTDIEAELAHYAEHFRGKTVYCNCDDPAESEFWKFFVRVFSSWGLKKLIATHYEPDEQNFSYKLEAEADADGNFNIHQEPVRTPLPCNGDFRSAACIELLKEADIVVTNPPFSLFREYVAQLMEYGKKFIIIGSVNAITYKEFFPLLMGNQVWGGFQFNKTMEFIMPDSYELKGKAYIDEQGRKHGFVPGVCWFTDLDIPKRHEPLDLRGNYYVGNEGKYPKYDNYDAIECSKVDDIPCDYDGVIGVPITFLNKYCPEQFEILGLSQKVGFGLCSTKFYDSYREMRQDGTTTGASGRKMNGNPVMRGKPVRGNYYFDGQNYAYSLYGRIFIQKKT